MKGENKATNGCRLVAQTLAWEQANPCIIILELDKGNIFDDDDLYDLDIEILI